MDKDNSELLERVIIIEDDNARLLERVADVEAEKAQLLERPSKSHASEFLDIPRERYEDWILTEDHSNVICELNKTGFVFETVIKEARAQAREARLACDYDLATPLSNSEEGNEEGVDQLADSA